MRYAVMNATIEQVKIAGGLNIKPTKKIGVIFADLGSTGVKRLEQTGCIVKEVAKVTTCIGPPIPVAASPVYSPGELMIASGYEDLRNLSSPPLFGDGINIAVVDTGIRTTHEAIRDRVVQSWNFTDSPSGDNFNHGTGVAGVIVVVVPNANLLDMKVIGDDGEGTEEAVTNAIDECLVLHDEGSGYAPHIINISLGATDTGPESALRVACRAALEAGIFILAAAGNKGPGPATVTSPATERYVAAVGSLSYDTGEISDYSSRGSLEEEVIKPDIVFWAEDLVVASSSSDTADFAKSGTSFATPFCTGMLAMWMEGLLKEAVVTRQVGTIETTAGPMHMPDDFLDNLLPAACGKPAGAPVSKDTAYGYGIPLGSYMEAMFVAAGISSIIGTITSMMLMMMMMGMMIPMVKGFTK